MTVLKSLKKRKKILIVGKIEKGYLLFKLIGYQSLKNWLVILAINYLVFTNVQIRIF